MYVSWKMITLSLVPIWHQLPHYWLYVPYAVLYILWLSCNYQFILFNPPQTSECSISDYFRFHIQVKSYDTRLALISFSTVRGRSIHGVADGKIGFEPMALVSVAQPHVCASSHTVRPLLGLQVVDSIPSRGHAEGSWLVFPSPLIQ